MKVLLTLIDGMRPDALTGCKSPVYDKLKEHSYSTLNAKTVYPSVTLPCHMSLFHSVTPERHGILTNTYVPQVRPVDGICEVLKKADKASAMFYTWEELKDITRPGSLACTSFVSWHALGDRVADINAKHACDFLREEKPDFCFLYFGNADEAGHSHGFMSEEYLMHVRKSLSLTMDAIKAAGDDYITILTADHGGHGRNHGDDIPEDMTIPMMIYNRSFNENELNDVSILDIAPTVTSILGVKAPREWEGREIALN